MCCEKGASKAEEEYTITTHSTPLLYHLVHGLLQTELLAGCLTDALKLLQVGF